MPKAISKADRPWRQRLADAARLRSTQGETTDEPVNYLTNVKLVAEREVRRQSITMTQNSPLLNANQQLQTQISELRNLVTDTKVKQLILKYKKNFMNCFCQRMAAIILVNFIYI